MAELITYTNVEIRQAEQVVLHDVNLHVQNGEMIYLLGKVGSGKSSLMKTIYGALPIAAGEARVLDYDIVHIRRRKLPCRIKHGITIITFRDQPVTPAEESFIDNREGNILKANFLIWLIQLFQQFVSEYFGSGVFSYTCINK